MTPLQTQVHALISTFEAQRGRKLSGRELSSMIGKSRNHLSQIMNDGLVPSGEVLVRLADVLGADEGEKRELVLAAMRTKADGRARDTFWLQRALDLTDALMSDIETYRDFLESKGVLADFDDWAESSAGPANGKNAADSGGDGGTAAEDDDDSSSMNESQSS